MECCNFIRKITIFDSDSDFKIKQEATQIHIYCANKCKFIINQYTFCMQKSRFKMINFYSRFDPT